MLVVAILGLVLIYVLLHVVWLYLRLSISAACARRRPEECPRILRAWVARQAAWSFDEAWKKFWA